MDINLLELGEQIIDLVGSKNIEGVNIVIDDVQYAVQEVYDDGWEDDGKYSQNYKVYRVGIAHKTSSKINRKIKTPLDLYLLQGITKCGSYFTDYEFEYEEPYMVKEIEKTVVVKEWVSIEE